MTAKAGDAVLNPVWMKAAILGGLWASIEIIIGSFFHNLRLPFAGTILAANATVLMIAFYQMWPEKGLIWRAGLIAALMKSVSPSAIILGPMTGILSEALIVEFFIRIFGNNLVSLSVAGALSVSSALIHKVASLLILYGLNIVKLYIDIFRFLSRQINLEHADPRVVVFVVMGGYLVFGIGSAILGYFIGRNSKRHGDGITTPLPELKRDQNVLSTDPGQKFSVLLFFVHLIVIPFGLLWLNRTDPGIGLAFVLGYVVMCILLYKRSLRRLRKPAFWWQLALLTLLASVFWNGVRTHGSVFDPEGLVIGLEMNVRALFVVIAFSSFGVELRNPVIRDFLFRKGFDKIYAALGLSFSALPVMIEAMPRPKEFLLHPIRGFSAMMIHARRWQEVFSGQSQEYQMSSPDQGRKPED